MINIEKGRYWDLPWQLATSCTRCSEGCRSCWALAMERRFHRGEEGRVVVHPERLDIPLRRKKPTVFAIWNDFFHESIPFKFQAHALAIMQLCTQHTFLILTKRPQTAKIGLFAFDVPKMMEKWAPDNHKQATLCSFGPWPLPNVWLGVTVCTQAEADEKIPILLNIPAAHRWLSIEPMLGAIDLVRWLPITYCGPKKYLLIETEASEFGPMPAIDAVILGGETGPKARPMHPDWARSVRDQCQAAGVPFFLKSSMGKSKTYWSDEIEEWGNMNPELFNCLEDGHIGAFPLWRMLDGREWNELPWSTK